MAIIYHNPRCRKSREGLEYLKNKTINIEIVEYLKEPLTKDTLSNIIKKLHVKPFDLVRTQEDYYKKELKGKTISDEEWIDILVHNPKLLQRPIVVNDNKACLAQPPENINTIL